MKGKIVQAVSKILSGENCILLKSVQEVIDMEALLLLTFANLPTINKFYLSHIKDYKCLKKVIHQIDSKNEPLLLLASFTAKFELILVLRQEKGF